MTSHTRMRTLTAPTKPSLIQRLVLGGLALLLCAGTAQAWWNDQWTLRKKITVDTSPAGAAITAPIGATPVLLRLRDANFRFADAAAGGSDLRFVAEDDKTVLSHHVEKFDPLLNEAFVWVMLPDLKPGVQTTFWLYYGNPSGKPPGTADAKPGYDADTVLVYHFAEHGQPPADASGMGNTGLTPGRAVEGSMIGTGIRFDGRETINLRGSDSLKWVEGGTMTWSAWLRFAAPQPSAVVFSRWDGTKMFSLGADKNVPFVEVTDPNGTRRSPAGAPVAAGSWHHVAIVAGGGVFTLYLDGENYASLAAPLPGLNGLLFLGGEGPVGATGLANDHASFVGEMDELEMARTARSPGFIKFAALSQGASAEGKLIVIGEDEQPKDWMSGFKNGYIGVIIGSLSVDGWVVIGILGVMGMISWFVMIGKAGYLNRVGRGNAQFLKEWSRVASDLSVLDQEDANQAKMLGTEAGSAAQRVMRSAPLYRVYHIGVEEIRHRLTADQRGGVGSRVLSARSIQAIRASLDGGLVRETQRLNNQMVLLTIAISGGPFLGLLGTVVGVMITFAAVAAAGDVNVNAIAPGIAAALAATVAGLAVAIPSLFGYNYLLTRIKSTTSDMHVFIDEFVAKMAEYYSETAEANRTTTRAPFSPSEP